LYDGVKSHTHTRARARAHTHIHTPQSQLHARHLPPALSDRDSAQSSNRFLLARATIPPTFIVSPAVIKSNLTIVRVSENPACRVSLQTH